VPLRGDRLALICPPAHPLAKRKKACAEDLQDQDFVLFERDIPTRRATDKILRAHNVVVRRVAEFDNIETIKRAVEVGLGCAVVPRPSVTDEGASGQLAVVPLVEPEWERTVGIIYRTDRALGTSARKFVELLLSYDKRGRQAQASAAKKKAGARRSKKR
jgi:DNA-binding transcriptional LysR family regulator